jgi:hypothetical protein
MVETGKYTDHRYGGVLLRGKLQRVARSSQLDLSGVIAV